MTQTISQSNLSKTDITAVLSSHDCTTPANTYLIQDSIHRITAECFANSPFHSKPLILGTGNYTLDDRISMRNKYKHKRVFRILL